MIPHLATRILCRTRTTRRSNDNDNGDNGGAQASKQKDSEDISNDFTENNASDDADDEADTCGRNNRDKTPAASVQYTSSLGASHTAGSYPRCPPLLNDRDSKSMLYKGGRQDKHRG